MLQMLLVGKVDTLGDVSLRHLFSRQSVKVSSSHNLAITRGSLHQDEEEAPRSSSAPLTPPS